MASGLRILVPVKRVIDYAVGLSPSKLHRDHEHTVVEVYTTPNNPRLTRGIYSSL